MGYNTIAEVRGSDLKDEVVMLGGHMDSWHSGTGATDNGAGVAVAMEVVRILQTLNLKPRRTIRVGLGRVRNKDCWVRALMWLSTSADLKHQPPERLLPHQAPRRRRSS